MKKALTLSIITFVSIFLIGTTLANAGGKPFEELQMQIDELNKRLDAMQPKENVEVYDYNDQFIGYLYGDASVASPHNYVGPILIPELDVFANFDGAGKVQRNHTFFYSEPDCGGLPYASANGSIRMLKYYADKLFIIDSLDIDLEIKSYGNLIGTSCSNYLVPCDPGCCCPPESVKRLTEIYESEIPFNLPVVMPLRYE